MRAIHQVGTRKCAVARATLTPGTGVIRVNNKSLDAMPSNLFKTKIQEPLILAENEWQKVNINIQVSGGGPNSQAEATRLAIAKALSEYNKDLANVFSDYDRALMVADVRRKESRKPNRQGSARSKRQKSYR